MFNGQKIKELIGERRVTKASIFTYANISKKSLDNIINGSNIPNSNNIEAIADFFRVPIDYFFDRKIDLSNTNIDNQIKDDVSNTSEDQKEIEYLRKLLVEKERTIQILMNKL